MIPNIHTHIYFDTQVEETYPHNFDTPSLILVQDNKPSPVYISQGEGSQLFADEDCSRDNPSN